MEFYRGIKYLALVCFVLSACFLFGYMNSRRDFKEAKEVYRSVNGSSFSKIPVIQIPEHSISADRKGKDQKEKALADEQEEWFLEKKSQWPSMVGWLSWGGGTYSYPVMQADDNDFYLNHLPDGSKNRLGSIFLDSSANEDFSSPVSVIYGHMVQSGEMFGSLKEYRSQSYYEKYPEAVLYTDKGRKTIQILASYLVDGERDVYPYGFVTQNDWESYMEMVKESSLIHGLWEEEQGDKLVIFSTCAYDFENARLAVLGRFATK